VAISLTPTDRVTGSPPQPCQRLFAFAQLHV
jgi:hypothetical protein